mgnify:CR=1 FL=1
MRYRFNSFFLTAILLLNFFIVISLTLFIIQMVLGTEVRESVDELLKLYGFNFRENIIESLNNTFKIHRK